VALLEARGFGPQDFARSHPGGALGRKLLTLVCDVMRPRDVRPIVSEDAPLSAAILEITRRRMGMTAVEDTHGLLVGIFTDGDLRRVFERGANINSLSVREAMTRTPLTIHEQALAVEAVRLMEEKRVSVLLVTSDERKLSGAMHIHDLLSAKVV
jgi:arabinose-5-phosphate isomerase